jgi:lipopolysaccharide biosynthesis glycosyltransferase
MTKIMHLCFCVDEILLNQLKTVISNIIKTNENFSVLNFHVIHENLDLFEDEDGFFKLNNIAFYSTLNYDLSLFPTSGHITKATYFRLLISDLLPKYINKVIYLDVDILVQKSLSSLYEIDLQKHALAAALDEDYIGNSKRLGLNNKYYFNAGVLLINLSFWRKYNVFENATKLMSDSNFEILWHDQDILNVLLNDYVFHLDQMWNYQLVMIKKNNYFKYLYIRPYIIHFTGSGQYSKPWFFKSQNIYSYKYRYLNKINFSSEVGLKLGKKYYLKRFIFLIFFKLGIV